MVFIILFLIEHSVSKWHNVASDLGLHCMSMSHKKNARHLLKTLQLKSSKWK